MPDPTVETKGKQVIITCPDETAAINCAEGLRKGFKSRMIRRMLTRAGKKKI